MTMLIIRPRWVNGTKKIAFPPNEAQINTTGECHLLALPKEVRDIVIDYTLVYDDTFTTINMYEGDVEDFKQPALSLVNRQLRNETLDIYYGQRKFVISSLGSNDEQWELVQKWFHAVQAHLHMIKQLELTLCDDHMLTLQLQAERGKKPEFKLYLNMMGSEDHIDMCDTGEAFAEVKDEMQKICYRVGEAGFGAEHYVEAGQLFLTPDRACRGWDPDGRYSDDDYDSDEDSDEDFGSDYDDEYVDNEDGDYDDGGEDYYLEESHEDGV